MTARSDSDQDLKVEYENIPGNATFGVSDPSGAAINPVGAGTSISGSGTVTFRVSQAGVYLVRLEMLTSPSTQGGVGAAQDRGTARLKVGLAARTPNPAQ